MDYQGIKISNKISTIYQTIKLYHFYLYTMSECIPYLVEVVECDIYCPGRLLIAISISFECHSLQVLVGTNKQGVSTVSTVQAPTREKRDKRIKNFIVDDTVYCIYMGSIFIKLKSYLFRQCSLFRMRNDYNPIRKVKKVSRAPPKRKIHVFKKPILMPPVVIATPFFVL